MTTRLTRAVRATPCRPMVRGVAVIEFALLLVPMLLLMFGTMELGRAVMSYQLMSRSVRDAVRHVSTGSASNLTQLRAEARCIAYSGDYSTVLDGGDLVTTCVGDPVAPDLAIDQVQVCDWQREQSEPLQPDGLSGCAAMRVEDATAGAIYLTSVGVRGYVYRGMFLGAFTSVLVPFGEISAVMRMTP
ncbi:TadE/TadG family type IV pilus assembly protein [Leptothrix sp. BB-4]